ncbi:MAG: hypothetical protein AN482_02050 [Anabaena sp. LE011-02]|nr:MAG: hypothetical protein AN482_02050 [Anabaena sp. LE011-02]
MPFVLFGENGNLGKKCLLLVINGVNSGRRRKEEGGRRKEEGGRKKKKISFSASLASLILSTGI